MCERFLVIRGFVRPLFRAMLLQFSTSQEGMAYCPVESICRKCFKGKITSGSSSLLIPAFLHMHITPSTITRSSTWSVTSFCNEIRHFCLILDQRNECSNITNSTNEYLNVYTTGEHTALFNVQIADVARINAAVTFCSCRSERCGGSVPSTTISR